MLDSRSGGEIAWHFCFALSKIEHCYHWTFCALAATRSLLLTSYMCPDLFVNMLAASIKVPPGYPQADHHKCRLLLFPDHEITSRSIDGYNCLALCRHYGAYLKSKHVT